MMIAVARDPDAVLATVTLAEAAATPWQAIVVGAGPAGAAIAWRLAARGIRVLLVDRGAFPRGKVCGCCLSTRATRELLALDADLVAGTVPLEAVRIAQRGRSARIPLPAGRVVSRDALDAWLVRGAIAAGCRWLPGARVAAIDEPGDVGSPVAVVVGDAAAAAGAGQSLSAEIVVIATGLADHVRIGAGGATGGTSGRRIEPRSRIGVGAVLPADACDLPPGELVMAVGSHGYCGIVRLEDGRIDVAAAIDRVALAGSADAAAAVAELLDEAAGRAGLRLPDVAAIRAASFRVTPPLTRRAPLVAGTSGRILRAGDAAGYVEPFTGEGIGWALASGRVAAEAVLAASGLRESRDAAARYLSAYHHEFGAAHARCRMVARGLRRAPVVAAAVAVSRMLPWAARRIVPAVIGAVTGGADE